MLLMDMNIRNFPEELHKDYKKLAIDMGIPMKLLIIKILEAWISGVKLDIHISDRKELILSEEKWGKIGE